MKKKLIALITALTLCAVVVVGGTLAYFSQQTDEIANTFTYNPDGEDPDPEIIEPNWPGDPDDPDSQPTVTPGTALPKDPQINLTNTALADDQEFYAAIVISGSSIVKNMNSLKAILADGTYKVGTKEVPDTDGNGNRILDAQGNPQMKTVDVMEDVGLAKIWGWSNAYTYDVGPATGTVYAYHTDPLSKANPTSAAVFQAVVTNSKIDSILKDLKDKDLERFYDIYVQGYVVSTINDTQLGANNQYSTWLTCKDAMVAAFPDIFTVATAPIAHPGYTEPANPFAP